MSSIPFYLGSYTTEMGHVKDASGEGIYSCSLNVITGKITCLHTEGNLLNPSYLDRDGESLYVACESGEGNSKLVSLKIKEDQSLDKVEEVQTHGAATCHVLVEQDKLYAASYLGGNLDVFEVQEGRLKYDQTIQYTGSGPNIERQEGAHAHQTAISPDKKWLYVCDLGADKVWIHALDGQLDEQPNSFDVPAGYGPRHLVFHPSKPHVYIAGELVSHLLVCAYDAETGQLKLLDDINTLPEDFKGEATVAAIRVHPSGKCVYISIRGHSPRGQNSIGVYLLKDNGDLHLFGRIPAGGEVPRDFNIDPSGHFMIIANHDSNNVCVYRLNPENGKPVSAIIEDFHCKSPACVLF